MYKIALKILRLLFSTEYESLLNSYSSSLNVKPVSDIPKLALDYLVAVEDRRYLSHRGADIFGIFRAVIRLIFLRKIEGASTIEQQLVRVLTARYERTVSRKMLEIVLAVLLSQEKSKEEMARLYLSVAYYGWRMNGYHEALHRICQDIKQPSSYELASIIARLRYPEGKMASKKVSIKIENRAKYAIRLSLNKLESSGNESI